MDDEEIKAKPWNFTTAKPGDLPEPKEWKMVSSPDWNFPVTPLFKSHKPLSENEIEEVTSILKKEFKTPEQIARLNELGVVLSE